MSEKYIPLYRKYRPKNLQEVVGQEHIKKALANAINLNKISHAYLFTGPRGTGKTSAARIMAKSLNCQQGPTLTPCEICPSCIDIRNSTPIDVIEIDAASNRKVEDAQNILGKIQYVPVNGKYKIYIIDEVHMLTNHAFNALLKTLEEPPENVIFILATTEPQKVLETITSRCQRFDFRRITTDDIVGHLKNISKLEKIKIDDDALFTIAKNAAGGMRDSLALLDQVSVLDGEKKISTEDVNALLGRLSFDVLNKLSENIIESKPQTAIEDLEKIYNSGNEPTQILINLLTYFKNLLIVKNCSEIKLLPDLTQLNEAQIKILQQQAENVDTHQIVFLIEKIAYYIKELKTTNNQHLWLEISMIDLANLAQNTSLMQLQERLSRLESGAPVHSSPVQYATHPSPVVKPILKETMKPELKTQSAAEVKKEVVEEVKSTPTKEIQPEAENEVQKKAEKDVQMEAQEEIKEEFSPMPKMHHASPDDISSVWPKFLELMNKRNMPACAMVKQHSAPVDFSAEIITLACKSDLYFKMLSGESKKKVIIETAKEFFGISEVNLTIRMATASDNKITASTTSQAAEKKNSIIKPSPQNEVVEIDEEELEEIIEEVKAPVKALKSDIKVMPSDQVAMVMNLFDGKYID